MSGYKNSKWVWSGNTTITNRRQNQMHWLLLIRAGIHKLLVRIAYWEDPDQTASSEAVWSGSSLFFLDILAGNYCHANQEWQWGNILFTIVK